jgi:hypothetical protein
LWIDLCKIRVTLKLFNLKQFLVKKERLNQTWDSQRRTFLRSLGLGIAGLTSFSYAARAEHGSSVQPTDLVPYVKGRFKHILDPPGKSSDPKKRPWYINDHHFFVEKKKQVIHWYGITNPIPPAGESMYGPGSSLYMGHASAPSPYGPWTEHPHAFSEPEEDGHIGCHFVVPYKEEYLMLYPNNRVDKKRLFVATSKDLFSWEKLEGFGPVGEGNLRDPCILKLEDGTYLLYAADFTNQRLPHVRLYKTRDLLNYEELETALLGPEPVSTPYYLESPFVLRHEGIYYLLVNFSHHQYSETVVYASKDPYKFDWEKPINTIFTHAPEILEWQGKYYISHCGLEDQHWERPGLYLAELVFK